MIYLSGCIREDLDGIGFLLTPNSEQRWKHWPPVKGKPSPRLWAADNGRFAAPDKYTDDGFLEWLDRYDRDSCLFATAPDVLGNHAATLEMSRPLLPRIRALGYKAAFIAQDGWDGAPWDEFDCIFIGGTTAFKLGEQVPGIVAEARRRGKWTHMGRVNSYKRLRVAKAIGVQSADGTFIKYGPDINSKRIARWLAAINAQPMLFHPRDGAH